MQENKHGAVDDAEDGFVLKSFLPYQISVLAGRLSKQLESRYRGRFGLSIPEWRIISHLSQEEFIGVSDLQKRVDLHKSRVSRAVRRLEDAGYVCRKENAQDGRRICLELTSKGREVMRELGPIAIGYQEELLNSLGIRKREFCEGLEQLLEGSRH